jgi:hypothetical protein
LLLCIGLGPHTVSHPRATPARRGRVSWAGGEADGPSPCGGGTPPRRLGTAAGPRLAGELEMQAAGGSGRFAISGGGERVQAGACRWADEVEGDGGAEPHARPLQEGVELEPPDPGSSALAHSLSGPLERKNDSRIPGSPGALAPSLCTSCLLTALDPARRALGEGGVGGGAWGELVRRLRAGQVPARPPTAARPPPTYSNPPSVPHPPPPPRPCQLGAEVRAVLQGG